MQEKLDTLPNFLDRWDRLSVRTGLNTVHLCEFADISRALYYAIREGSRAPTDKVLAKLAVAEAAAGISAPKPESAKSEGNAKDLAADSKNSLSVEARFGRLEAEVSGLREELAGLYELLAARARQGTGVETAQMGGFPETGNVTGFQKTPNVLGFPPAPEPNVVELRFYGTVAAGVPGGPLDTDDGTFAVPGSYDPASHYVVRVNGRSMEPDYPDGSRIICRRLRDGEYAKKNQDVIASDANGTYFKRLVYSKSGPKTDQPRRAVPTLVSLNPEYPAVVPVADCPIVAVVVGKALNSKP